jgi:NAD(P)-dependent dehydrogenase (short-subunit alcohol dehydrogenase family)
MDYSNKTMMVTGANSGIGKVTALELAKTGARVVMICRDRERGHAAKNEIVSASGNKNVDLLIADLSSLAAIRNVVSEFLKKYDQLHVLVNNAGAIFSARKENVEGIEMTFAVNHLGYFRLTNLLLDTIRKSAPARIVNVASEAERFARLDLDDLQSTKRYRNFEVYGKSKLANILFTRELAKKLEGTRVTVNALHPGFVRTNFGQDRGKSFGSSVVKFIGGVLGVSPEKGAETSVYLALSPEVENITGKYFSNKKIITPVPDALDDNKAARLWEESEKLSK